MNCVMQRAAASPKYSAAELARSARVGRDPDASRSKRSALIRQRRLFVLHSFLAHLHRKQHLFLKDFTHLCIPLEAAMTTRHTYEELAERCVPPEPAQPSSRIADYDTPFLPFPPIPYRDLSTSHHCNLNRLPQISCGTALSAIPIIRFDGHQLWSIKQDFIFR